VIRITLDGLKTEPEEEIRAMEDSRRVDEIVILRQIVLSGYALLVETDWIVILPTVGAKSGIAGRQREIVVKDEKHRRCDPDRLARLIEVEWIKIKEIVQAVVKDVSLHSDQGLSKTRTKIRKESLSKPRSVERVVMGTKAMTSL